MTDEDKGVLTQPSADTMMWRHLERRQRDLELKYQALADMINDLYSRAKLPSGIPIFPSTDAIRERNRYYQRQCRARKRARIEAAKRQRP